MEVPDLPIGADYAVLSVEVAPRANYFLLPEREIIHLAPEPILFPVVLP
jgi:hypothetical protein